jgi:hypothetical protein
MQRSDMSFRPVDTTHKSQSNVVAPLHDKGMAAEFLALLDPTAKKFTFQFLSDWGDGHPQVFHGPLDEVWAKVEALNSPVEGMGAFVTINETDLQGRKSENIVRARALFADADNADQLRRTLDAIGKSGATPTMVVRTSRERAHSYWCCDDIALEDFPAYQAALIEKLGTDSAIKDLPRVMRLPGTLHLKDPNKPQKVVLKRATKPRRWKIGEVVKALGLQPSKSAAQGTTSSAAPAPAGIPAEIFTAADAERLGRKFASVSGNDLAAGIETNIEEIKSAVAAIPPAAIATEGEWVKLARGFAHEARVYAGQAEELWEILETASRAAPGYDQAENRSRWLRYIAEALDRENPITIATPLDMAKKHGWKGWSPPAPALVTSSSPTPGPTASPTSGLTISFANIPHRRWQYGIDLLRGEITLLGAPGGVGKSSLAIGVSVAIATGKPLLDEKVWEGELRCLYFNGEDSGTEMLRRIYAFCLRHGIAEQDLGRLLVAGADDWRVQRTSFLRTEKGNSVLDEAGLAHFETVIESLRPDTVVVDPLVVFCGGGNINDNAVMALVMRALKRLAGKYDFAGLLIHHTKKGADLSNAEAISGASAIVNLARRAIMTVPMTLEEAKAAGVLPSYRSRYFKVVAAKSNLAPRSEDAPRYELCSITLPNAEPPVYTCGDGVQAVARVKLSQLSGTTAAGIDQNVQRAILDAVDLGKLIDGQRYPYSPNVTGANNQRALIEDGVAAVASATAPKQWETSDLRAVVERSIAGMKSDGWLIDVEIGGGRFRRGRGLEVDWSRTPWPPKVDPASEAGNDPERLESGSAGGGQWSMPRSMNDQLPKQGGGGQLPPFKGRAIAFGREG